MIETTFLIIGGGIAGVTCAETLAFLKPDQKIILISESSLIKSVTNLLAITQTLTQFDIEEKQFDQLSKKYDNIEVIHDSLREINVSENTIVTNNSITVSYKFLCLCTGAKPKVIPQGESNPYVLGIRDTDSIDKFITKLQTARKIAIIGNGGIASELIYKISNVLVDWVIKDSHITATFVDPGAAEFFRPSLSKNTENISPGPHKRMRYEEENYKSGAALGPDWYKSLNISGASLPSDVKVHYSVEIADIEINEKAEYPVEVLLNNGEKIMCDFIVSATGVEPHIPYKTTLPLDLSFENGIKVNEFMQSSVPNIFAAGDVCTPTWLYAKQWFCMKLWTQARQMGCYAAKSMVAHFDQEPILQDFCFELFTHSTRLFGYKVVLIGLFNGQKLGTDYEILLRMTKGVEYIKFVLQNGKLQGAVLIGDTDLEETCENLILNQIDLSLYKEELLDPNIDIEDYFD